MQGSQSEESILDKVKPFGIDLNQDQVEFIQRHLPQFFSVHQVKKVGKRPKKEFDSKVFDKEPSLNAQPKSSRYLDSNKDEGVEQLLPKRSRSKKIDDYGIEESPKRKPKSTLLKTGTSGIGGTGGLAEEEFAVCNSIITQLKKNPNSGPFLTPVNPVELKIPDYFDIISTPMDISTIESKLKFQGYSTTRQFKDDLTLIWMNSYKYNPKGSEIYFMTSQMDKLSNKLLEKLSSSAATSYSSTMLPVHYPETTPKKAQSYNYSYPQKEKKPKPVQKQVEPATARMMTIFEKRKICDDIKNLSKDYLPGVWKILAQDNDYPDMVFDVEKLSAEKLWQLEAYLRTYKGLEADPGQVQGSRARSQESSSFLIESESQK